jgi:predicted PurR-regulated permease PerM
MSQSGVIFRNDEASAPALIAVRPAVVRPVEAGAEPAEEARTREVRTRLPWSRPMWIIALCCVAVVLRLGREALIPLGLALLVTLVLSGIVEGLRRWRIPRALSAAALLLLLAAVIGGTLDAIATPAQEWVQNAPRTLRMIEHRLRPAQSLLHRLEDLTQRAESLATSGSSTPEAAAPSAATAATGLTALDVFAATGWVAVGAVTVLAFAFLLLAAGPSTLARMTCALAGGGQTKHVLQVLAAIRSEVGRYYGTLLLINLGYGIVTGVVMWLLGMPNAALWAVLAAALNFVPYLGPAITLAILTVVALVTFSSTAHVLLVSACYPALATVEGHVVEPVFLGRRLDLSPIWVLFALWIGAWLWGVAGMVLALPALLAIRVAARMAGAPHR